MQDGCVLPFLRDLCAIKVGGGTLSTDLLGVDDFKGFLPTPFFPHCIAFVRGFSLRFSPMSTGPTSCPLKNLLRETLSHSVTIQ